MRKGPMTPIMAIKIDLLSYFFRKNIDYQIEYGRLSSDVVIPSILVKILTIDKEDIDGLKETF
jgi:hypothetical protein